MENGRGIVQSTSSYIMCKYPITLCNYDYWIVMLYIKGFLSMVEV